MMAQKKNRVVCRHCGRRIVWSSLTNELKKTLGNEKLELAFSVTKDGMPYMLCPECVELLMYQWSKELWEYGNKGNMIYLLTAISHALKEHNDCKKKLENLVEKYDNYIKICEKEK